MACAKARRIAGKATQQTLVRDAYSWEMDDASSDVKRVLEGVPT